MSASLPRKLLLTFDSGVSNLKIRQKEMDLEILYRGSPDSTSFAPPGNRTIEKIILNARVTHCSKTVMTPPQNFWAN